MNSNTQNIIPQNTMGYLKFAYFILQSNISLHDFFLDKSIQQIVHIVNDVVNNGNQHIDILRLLPHDDPLQPEPLINPHNIDPINPDNIVNQLVSLARNTPETNVKKIRAKPTPKVKNPTPETLETPPKVKKIRAKAIPKAVDTPIVETPIVETPNVDTPDPKIKKTRAKAIPNADTPISDPKVKKVRAKAIPKLKSTLETPIVETPIVETPIVETSSNVETPIVETSPNVEVKKTRVPKAKPIADPLTETHIKKVRLPKAKVITNHEVITNE